MRKPFWLLIAPAVLAGSLARAEDATYGALAPFRPVEEVRAGLYGDDAVHRERQAPMATVQVLSSPMVVYRSANPWLSPLFAPRIEAGGMFNGFGLTSYVFAGLNWREPIAGPLFLEVGFGGAINDSSRNPHNMRQTDLGCPVSFRELGELAGDSSEHFDVVAGIEHISHANLCSNINPGLTSAGLRIGYHF